MSDSPKPDSRRGSLGPAPVEFGAYNDQGNVKFYNCAPVKPRKGSLTPSDDKDLKLGKDEVFGVFDDGSKIHYYNCAPIKQKKAKTSPPAGPLKKKMFNRIFKGEGGTPSGSDLSLSSTGSGGSAKN